MKLAAAVHATLDTFAAHGGEDRKHGGGDPGPLVLAALAARSNGGVIRERVLERWLEELRLLLQSGALTFGPAGPFAALAVARPVVPRLGPLCHSLWDQVAEGLPGDCWRTRDVTWVDYDVIRGPAGMLLSLVASGRLRADGAAARRRLAGRCARQLLELCGEEELASFRLGRDHGDERLRWGEGRVNTGLAHGVAGVALALRSALEHGLAPAGRTRAALTRLASWLVAQSYVDRTGLRAWPHADLDGGAPPPQALRPQSWCYGTPGIAWSLWESGRVLGRREIQSFALAAMGSWCARVVPPIDRSADRSAQLALCHGVAGDLAIADCFARHARFAPAAKRARELERRLVREFDPDSPLARDASLLDGAPGILAVLLTRRGAPRGWLVPLGLR
jgi:class I lanthipeptide synthase